MRNLVIIFILILTLFSCEKPDHEIPIQIVNNDGSSYSNTFEKAIKRKLSRHNFLVVNYEALYVITLNDFYVDELYEYETVFDDCVYGVTDYELLTEWLSGSVSLWEGNEIVKTWNIEASQSEILSDGEPLLIDILSPDDDCEEDGNCPDCTDYYVKSPVVLNINNELKSSARKVVKEMSSMTFYY